MRELRGCIENPAMAETITTMYIVQNRLNFALGFGFENSLVRFVTDMQIAQARRATQPRWVPTEAQAVRLRGVGTGSEGPTE